MPMRGVKSTVEWTDGRIETFDTAVKACNVAGINVATANSAMLRKQDSVPGPANIMHLEIGGHRMKVRPHIKGSKCKFRITYRDNADYDTAAELARDLGVTPATVRAWIRGAKKMPASIVSIERIPHEDEPEVEQIVTPKGGRPRKVQVNDSEADAIGRIAEIMAGIDELET